MKMDLNTFREKLSYEIEKFEEYFALYIEGLDKIQVHVYCIAALLRKIVEMIPDYRGRNIPVYESDHQGVEKHASISLKDILNSTIHYHYFQLWSSINRPNSLDYLEIISDWEKEHLNRRKIKTEDFMDIAKEIAENDEVPPFI